jgi:hypothetical protein
MVWENSTNSVGPGGLPWPVLGVEIPEKSEPTPAGSEREHQDRDQSQDFLNSNHVPCT